MTIGNYLLKNNISKNELLKKGVYRIYFSNDLLKRSYIGIAIGKKGILGRISYHFFSFKSDKALVTKLSRAAKKYSIENVVIEVLHILSDDIKRSEAMDIETSEIIKFDSVKNGWNIIESQKDYYRCNLSKSITVDQNKGEKNGMYGKFDSNNPVSKPVYQYDLSGNFIRKWDSARMITRETGIPYKQISQAFKVSTNYCKGFVWHNKFLGDKIQEFKPYNRLLNFKGKHLRNRM